MSIFKKKTKPIVERVELPEHYNELWNDLITSKNRLEGKMISALTISNILKTLPECPDKKAFEEQLADSQYCVRCEIGEYDWLRSEVIKMIEKYDQTRQQPPTSHEVMVRIMRSILDI